MLEFFGAISSKIFLYEMLGLFIALFACGTSDLIT